MNEIPGSVAMAAYFLSSAAYLVYAARQSSVARQAGFWILALGFACQLANLIGATVRLGQPPVIDLRQSLAFFGMSLAAAFLVATIRFRLHLLGALAAPAIFLLAAPDLMAGAGATATAPVFRSYWLPVHLGAMFLGYSFFGLTFLAALLYLLQERQIKMRRTGRVFRRLPPLGVLDEIGRFGLTLGFPLITLGIAVGMGYAHQAFGVSWRWDPKEVWSLLLWLYYAVLLHQRLTVGWRGRRAAVMSVIGFGVLCFTFVGVSLAMSGYHSFHGLTTMSKP